MLDKIIQMIVSTDLQSALLPLKIIVVFLTFSALIALIYFLLKTSYLRYRYLDAWSDYIHWRDTYGPKTIKRKKKARRLASTVAPPSPIEIISSAPGSVDEDLDLRDGRVERSDWERIIDKLESNNELNYKLAFIDADKLLNQALKNQGYRSLEVAVSNADDVLKAKEVLEKMLDYPEAKLSAERAKELIDVYQKALAELKVI